MRSWIWDGAAGIGGDDGEGGGGFGFAGEAGFDVEAGEHEEAVVAAVEPEGAARVSFAGPFVEAIGGDDAAGGPERVAIGGAFFEGFGAGVDLAGGS